MVTVSLLLQTLLHWVLKSPHISGCRFKYFICNGLLAFFQLKDRRVIENSYFRNHLFTPSVFVWQISPACFLNVAFPESWNYYLTLCFPFIKTLQNAIKCRQSHSWEWWCTHVYTCMWMHTHTCKKLFSLSCHWVLVTWYHILCNS